MKVNFKCGCGQIHSYTQDAGITIERKQTAEATCLASGEVQYTATVIFDDEPITDTYVEVIPANGHQMTGTADCDSESTCANCDYTVEALGHNWVADAENSQAATCQSHAVEAFKCSVCGDTKTNTLEGLERHNYVYVEDKEIASCVKAKLYRCDSCGDEITGDTYTTHTYVAAIETEATCNLEGVKKYSCTLCSDSYTEAIPTNDSHTWDEGVTAEGITTYTCQGCGTTKTAVVAQGNTATVSKETLQDTEVQVNEAAIRLDEQTLEELGEEVKIDVEVKSAEDVTLDDELKAQIGENPVYDFSLSSDNSQVSQFAGSITISLPYTLQEGDDVDCIDVWFINDNGEVECVMGVYCNGYVTFTTDHFSYYTVTRLTPKQRCEHYGHLFNFSYKAPTCTANGHDIQTCKRCGHVEKDEVLPMTAHKFVETAQDATCINDGYTSKSCPVCKLTISGVLPALGHNWELDEERSEEANCNQAGYETYVCTGCGDSYRSDLAQLKHSYVIVEEMASDCVNQGYKVERCELCEDEKRTVTGAPTGHAFTAENADWQWEEDYSGATVTLTCANDPEHTKTLTAVVGREIDEGNICSDKITYKAVASFNKTEFVDYRVVELGVVSHTPGLAWLSDDVLHYRQCQVCKEYVDVSKHNWDEGTVITEPTCAEKGLVEYVCTVCGTKHEQDISATGEHVYVDGFCTGCGLEENTCTHFPLNNIITIDNEKWGICEDTVIEFASCDCGEYTRFVRREGCEMPHVRTETVVTNLGEYEINVTQCIHCGLINKTGFYEELDEENCITRWYETYALYRDDELIAIDYNLMVPDGKPMENEHVTNKFRTVDLSEYGMCGVVLIERYCHCGEETFTEGESTSCNWQYVETDNEDVTKEYCANCGTTYTNTFVPKQEGCWWHNSRVHTYERDGEVLYSYVIEWSINNCEYETTKVEYIDGSCENGAIVYYECVNCGEESYETWYGSHPHAFTEEIPVEGEGICWNQVYRHSCPCGEDVYIDYATNCWFDCVSSKDDNTYEEYKCRNCGLTRIITRTYTDKDENCYGKETVTYTYIDANGNELCKVQGTCYGEYHNLVTTGQLMDGSTSCDDGAVEIIACKDCGQVIDYIEYDYHMNYVVDRIETKEYGMCGDVIAVLACACGEEREIQTETELCNWEYQYDPETGMYYQCSVCGTIRTYDSYRVSTEGCKENWTHDIIYIQNDEEILRIQNPYTEYNHRTYYTFELLGKTCEDGYIVTQHCKDCDYESDWGEYSGSHSTWIVDRKFISQGKLCGDLESVSYSCACGQEKYNETQWWGGSCSYDNGEYYIESLGAWVSKCSQCGYEQIRKETQEPGASRCETLITNTYTFRKNGVNMFAYADRYVQNNHTYVFTFDRYGETCDDGYDAVGVCYYCGSEGKWLDQYTGCGTVWPVKIQTQQLDEESCGYVDVYTYSCSCGRSGHIDFEGSCQWNWIDSTEESGQIYHCENCDLYAYKKQVTQMEPNSCMATITDTLLIQRGNDVIYRYENVRNAYVHTEVVTFELLGETCDDGYICTEKCYLCGKTLRSWEDSSHTNYVTERIDLRQYGLCQGYITKNSCACAENVSWNLAEICSWDCETCGIEISMSQESVIDRENCRNLSTYHYGFTKDGEEVYTFTGDGWNPKHEMVTTFQLYNEEYGCDGGYEATVSCRNCDYSYTSGGSDHTTYEVEHILFKDFDEDICDGAIVISRCACGEYTDTLSSFSNCQASTYEYEEFVDDQGFWHNRYTYPCDICGMEKVEEWYDVIDRENCSQYQVRTLTYRYNDEVIYENTIRSGESEYHDYSNVVQTLVPGATSCEEGVLITATCHCGEVEEYMSYGHSSRTQEKIDLTAYGLCSGYLAYEVCACGQYDNWYLYDCCGGCEVCGLNLQEETTYKLLDSVCRQSVKSTYRIFDGEELLFEETVEGTEEFHVEVASFQLFDEEAGCEGGYQVTTTCRKCGYTNTWEEAGHIYYPVDYLFLDAQDADFCEGYITKEVCACGKNQLFSTYRADCSFVETEYKEFTDEQGVFHINRTNTCEYCGLEQTEDHYAVVDAENCLGISYIKYAYRVNGAEVIDCLDVNSEYDSHTYDNAQYTLPSGVTSCEDGVVETATCKYCGAQTETTYYYHVDIPVETIDLQQYGAACGTQFVKYQCACGYHTYGSLVGDQMCDMQIDYVDSWIEGSIDDTYQDTSNGGSFIDSDYWISTCAVTDPQCAFKIRGAQYYVQEGCEAVQYDIWQFGFNEETGDWAYEVKYPTGRKHTFHSYVHEEIYEEVDENTTITGYTEICSNCQSSISHEEKYIDGNHVSTNDVAVNRLDNGENREYRYYYEYSELRDGCNVDVLNLHETTYADGSQHWSRYEYTYPGDCTRTKIYTDSNGEYSEEVETCHWTQYENETIRNSTCTQSGQYVDRWKCVVCGEIESEDFYTTVPAYHYWIYIEETNSYKCDTCGLESVNDATGSIVMEDMTESYGNGTDYVVGYWNQTDVSVHKYVSVVLNDVQEGAEDELILDDIAFTELTAENDGITAISFSQADALAKAQAAMEAAGYTGDYAIRFTFVPTDAGDTLDYAITFDALSV